MTYNRFLYNTALYNAGQEEVGAVARSIIQAHTGPHIQAVVGSTPTGDRAGISFLSDFVITEGTVKKPPASYNFPDLSARIKAVVSNQKNLVAFIQGVFSVDLPAAIYIVEKIPDLAATIFALGQADLGAVITEKLFNKITISDTKDLIGLLQALPAIVDLPAQVVGSGGYGNLGAKIHSPLDLAALLQTVQKGDLPADIFAFQFADLPGFMFGQPASNLTAFLRTVTSATADLSAYSKTTTEGTPDDLAATIETNTDGLATVLAAIRAIQPGVPDDLAATIVSLFGGEDVDLPATIFPDAAKVLKAIIGTIAVGEKDRFLPAFLQPVNASDLAASMIINANFKTLGAFIEAPSDTRDLGAFVRVAETFVTALLTVTTLAARDLRATIGRPDCAGGSAKFDLAAILEKAQAAANLGALIDSFIETDLGASINTGEIFHAMDFLDVLYSRKRVRNPIFLATDTLDVVYNRFRGSSLAAIIQAVPQNVDLGAVITATFPLLRVSPSVTRLLSADLRAGEDLNIREVRLELEGALLEYFYVNGTDDAFIRDATQDWKINVRSFRPIAENLFGDFAAGRVCRLGDLTSYATLDEAVRACINAVIGLDGQANMGASISASGQIDTLLATLEVSDIFTDLSAFADRVFPADIGATITGTP